MDPQKILEFIPRDVLIFVGGLIAASVGGIISNRMEKHRELQLERTRYELDRINAQINDVYAPMVGLRSVARVAYRKIVTAYPEFGRSVLDNIADDQMEQWKIWMETIFDPLNTETSSIITKNLDLIDEGQLPPLFVEFLLHDAMVKALLAGWASRETFSNEIFVRYPRALDGYVQEQLAQLQARRSRLVKRLN